MRRGLIVCLMGFAMAGPALAADPPSADTRRLSEAEVKQILDTAETKRAEPDAQSVRKVEGELGVAIGTGGYREAFGTAVVPLGGSGVAILSFDHQESNRGRARRHR